jgi:hypothetical protein
LLRLAALAADAELFGRNPRAPGRYVGRLLGRAICQGAALHYADGKNGVKDFDVWSFYAQNDDWPFPVAGAERGTSALEVRQTPVIRHVNPAGASTFFGCSLPSAPGADPAEAVRRYLASGWTAGESAVGSAAHQFSHARPSDTCDRRICCL